MVGFLFHEEPHPDNVMGDAIPDGLSENPNFGRKMPIKVEMEGIVKAFKKRGFTAYFKQLPETNDLPNWTLIVRRDR